MKNLFTKKDKRTPLEKERDRIVESLEPMMAGTDEYRDVLEDAKVLNDMTKDSSPKKSRLEPNTIFQGVISLLCTVGSVAIIVLAEANDSIIRSKAISFVPKGRV